MSNMLKFILSCEIFYSNPFISKLPGIGREGRDNLVHTHVHCPFKKEERKLARIEFICMNSCLKVNFKTSPYVFYPKILFLLLLLCMILCVRVCMYGGQGTILGSQFSYLEIELTWSSTFYLCSHLALL